MKIKVLIIYCIVLIEISLYLFCMFYISIFKFSTYKYVQKVLKNCKFLKSQFKKKKYSKASSCSILTIFFFFIIKADLIVVLSYNFIIILRLQEINTKLNFECQKHNTVVVLLNTNDFRFVFKS